MTADKESIRSIWNRTLAAKTSGPKWGRASEKLRILQAYRDADTIFAAPGNSLLQARINCLADGKNLVLPTPSLREGFFLLPAHSVPFKDIAAAVTYKGLAQHGQLLKYDDFRGLSVGLLLTDSLAVDSTGGRIGDGNGFFDLSCALLQELGALEQGWSALTFILEEQLSTEYLPQGPWDIKVSGAVTPEGIHTLNPPPQTPRIFWDLLPRDRVRRIDPLWKLYSGGKRTGIDVPQG